MKDDKFVTNTITLKDASIFCRNFLGVKSEKNSSGSRSFLVEIPEEIKQKQQKRIQQPHKNRGADSSRLRWEWCSSGL